MIRINQKSLVFLINNGGYTIEVEVHDGPYNSIKNWSYTGVIEAFTNGEGNIFTTKVTCKHLDIPPNFDSQKTVKLYTQLASSLLCLWLSLKLKLLKFEISHNKQKWSVSFGLSCQVANEAELITAITTASTTMKDAFCFIEVICHKDDTSKELLEWGSRVSAANGRPPQTYAWWQQLLVQNSLRESEYLPFFKALQQKNCRSNSTCQSFFGDVHLCCKDSSAI